MNISRRAAGLLLAMAAMAVVTPACSAARTPTEGGCPQFMAEFLNRSGDSVFGDHDRPQLRQAWEVLAADLSAAGLLDICKGDPEDGLGVTPLSGLPNGTPVRVRPVVPSPFDPEESIAAQVIYVTETADGTRAHAMTLMALKADAVLSGSTPDQVVFTHGTAGIHRDCDQALDTIYSAQFLRGLRGTGTAAVSAVAQALLDGGKVVQAPYYLGIGPAWSRPASPYLSRDTTGRTVIDGVRAVASVGAGSRWGVVGHSQGGHAALAAARLAPSYGAGTELVGAVAAGAPLDLEGTLDYWLDSVAGEADGTDPRPADGAPAPDSPSVMTLAAHLLWGLRQDVPLPDPLQVLNRFAYFDARQSIFMNALGDLNPLGPSLVNSGDPPTWNPAWGIYTSGPSAVPDSGQVSVLTPAIADLEKGFGDLHWLHSPWSVPRPDRLVLGCGWATNGAPGGVMYQYAVNYRGGQMQYPAGFWSTGLPMMLAAAYQDPTAAAWDPIRAALGANSLHTEAFDAPVLVTAGGVDRLFPAGPPGTTARHTVRAAVASMCTAGSDVELLVDPTADHGGALTQFVAPATSWLLDRFAGVPVDAADTCTNL